MDARPPSQLLARAWELYKKNARAFLLTAGIAIVPVALVHAAIATAVLPAPANLSARGESIQRYSEELQRRMAAGTLTREDAARLQQQITEKFGRTMTETGAAMGGFALFELSMLLLAPIAALGAFLGSAALVPMVRDAEAGDTGAARRRHAEFLGTPAQDVRLAAADECMVRQRILSPVRFTRMLSPGFDG